MNYKEFSSFSSTSVSLSLSGIFFFGWDKFVQKYSCPEIIHGHFDLFILANLQWQNSLYIPTYTY